MTAPYQAHSQTSYDAALGIGRKADALRRQVFEFLKQKGDRGATDLEMQSALKMIGSTQRPRRRELQLAGLVRDSGNTRKTASGRNATVWVTP